MRGSWQPRYRRNWWRRSREPRCARAAPKRGKTSSASRRSLAVAQSVAPLSEICRRHHPSPRLPRLLSSSSSASTWKIYLLFNVFILYEIQDTMVSSIFVEYHISWFLLLSWTEKLNVYWIAISNNILYRKDNCQRIYVFLKLNFNISTKIDLHKYWWNHSTSIFFCTKWIFFINPPPNLELGINVLSVYRSPYILNEIYFCCENLNVLSLDGVDRITRTVSFIHDFVWMNEWNWNKVEYVTNCFVRNTLMAADVIISGSWV